MAAKKSKRGTKRVSAAKPGAPRASGARSYGRSYSSAIDKSKALPARISELAKLVSALCQDEEVFRGILALLEDTADSPELRRAALRTLQAASFSAVAFNARRTEYLAGLRALSQDPDPEIRQSILGILARERDGHVQQLLLEGLEDPAKALVPPEKALQLLSYDIHAEAYPLARSIVKKPPNAEAKREALRLLGADAGSVSLFESVLRDKQEDPTFRRLSASALQALKPSSLQHHAREIVLDDDEDDQVKATGLAALSQFGSEGVGRDDELRAKILQLQASASADVQRGAQAFHAKYRSE